MVPERPQARANPARGIALIATAVIVGFFLLRNGWDEGRPVLAAPSVEGADGGATAPPGEGGTSTPPTQPLRPPNEITVRVLNASGVSGAARLLTDAIQAEQYNVVEPSDGPAEVAGGDGSTTVVLYAPGYAAEAGVLAGQVGAAAASVFELTTPPQGGVDPAGAQLIVILGTDRAQSP